MWARPAGCGVLYTVSGTIQSIVSKRPFLRRLVSPNLSGVIAMSPEKTTKKRSVLVRRGLSAVFLLLVIGYIYQVTAERSDFEKYPPPGRLVDVGGSRIHLFCEGNGMPTVVTEAGGGGFSWSWNPIRPAIAEITRICVYDRAGFGWSDYQDTLPTRERVVANLSTTLAKAGISGPYVLVGHSLGGIYVRGFAQTFPTNVAGIVLVDSSHENQLSRMPIELREAQRKQMRWMSRTLRACQFATVVGLVRAIRLWNLLDRSANEGAPSRRVYEMSRYRTSFCPAMLDALEVFSDTVDQAQAPQSLGKVPLIVLSHGKNMARNEAEDEWEQTWPDLQQELAELSSNGVHRVVPDAGHGIQFDRPDAVIEAVIEVIEMAQ